MNFAEPNCFMMSIKNEIDDKQRNHLAQIKFEEEFIKLVNSKEYFQNFNKYKM
jgi:hypothetical protein